MSKVHSSYAQAAKFRKRDEMTIFDPIAGGYRNVKIFQKPSWGKFKW
jgi:hypothetical protein